MLGRCLRSATIVGFQSVLEDNVRKIVDKLTATGCLQARMRQFSEPLVKVMFSYSRWLSRLPTNQPLLPVKLAAAETEVSNNLEQFEE